VPRHIIRPPDSSSPKYAKLVKKLVEELKGDRVGVQPVILEVQIPATGSRHVRVIWDEWERIDDEQRSLIIVEAYTKLEGEEVEEQLTVADGVTPTEALALGLLPFKIVPMRKRDDPIPLEEYRKAQLNEGKTTVLGPKAEELRYPLLEDAEAGMRRLQEALPDSHWSVVQEVGTES
jgi:hypothetical protein